MTPTLAVGRQRETLGRVDYEKHPERKYIFPGMWESWEPQKGRRRPLPDAAISSLGLVRTKTAVLIKLMQSGGVGLLAGSDSGASNNFTFPGQQQKIARLGLIFRIRQRSLASSQCQKCPAFLASGRRREHLHALDTGQGRQLCIATTPNASGYPRPSRLFHFALNESFWIRLFQVRFYSVHPARLGKTGRLGLTLLPVPLLNERCACCGSLDDECAGPDGTSCSSVLAGIRLANE